MPMCFSITGQAAFLHASTTPLGKHCLRTQYPFSCISATLSIDITEDLTAGAGFKPEPPVDAEGLNGSSGRVAGISLNYAPDCNHAVPRIGRSQFPRMGLHPGKELPDQGIACTPVSVRVLQFHEHAGFRAADRKHSVSDCTADTVCRRAPRHSVCFETHVLIWGDLASIK